MIVVNELGSNCDSVENCLEKLMTITDEELTKSKNSMEEISNKSQNAIYISIAIMLILSIVVMSVSVKFIVSPIKKATMSLNSITDDLTNKQCNLKKRVTETIEREEAKDILDKTRERFKAASISVSIGSALMESDKDLSLQEYVNIADLEMYEQKREKKGTLVESIKY